MGLEKGPITLNLVRSSLCALVVFLAPWSSSQAQNVSTIQIVHGQGAILCGAQSKARENAIASSFRQALEQTVAEILDPDTSVSHAEVLTEQIYRQAPQYVAKLFWGVVGIRDLQQQVYRVELEVEVAIDAVTQAILSLGLSQVD